MIEVIVYGHAELAFQEYTGDAEEAAMTGKVSEPRSEYVQRYCTKKGEHACKDVSNSSKSGQMCPTKIGTAISGKLGPVTAAAANVPDNWEDT